MKKSIIGKVTEIKCNSKRVGGILYQYKSAFTFLSQNVYMPCDGSNKQEEYTDTLNELNYLIVKYDANYLIFGGDLNTDMSRNHCQTKLLSDLYKLFTEKKILCHINLFIIY